MSRSKVFAAAAAACFTLAALSAGGVTTWPAWAWGFGGFAAWMMATI